MTEYRGIKINERAIAQGIYDMFSDDDKTVMAFGMIPYKWIKLLRKQLADKADEIINQHCQEKLDCSRAAAESLGFSFTEFKKGFIDTIENEVSKSMYSVAKMVV